MSAAFNDFRLARRALVQAAQSADARWAGIGVESRLSCSHSQLRRAMGRDVRSLS
jgi:hypothetical protein